MIDFERKEKVASIKAKVLGILSMVIGDDLYNKEMMVPDLTNLVALLDEMAVMVKRIEPEYLK
ncbi:hypothetical protein [Neobacillus vireti]|uniref:Uncharacterized protein n=1 Tax=Neobacillus vireti LMG 21834 TaxID=1131730 RepID=A0AB94IL28_9BACI|nr:hypothetical protein [Neobacillus vireti]ETI67765.1 hypothetical protein BAVI_15997 [Neobacillus vireti LMG 21834]KLT16107.1 hypothetical protein AA980_19265 [Neobacillus vireti]